MRKISNKEMKSAGNIYCPFRKPKKVKSIWRKDGGYYNRYHVACEKHKEKS